jgi:tRNA threonylcarbamoyladenosine biosynthesis protein TsaE
VPDLADLLPAETDSPEATLALGRALAACLAPGTVVALHGDLGAGKTHLVKGIAEAFGGDARAVTSPTFTLVHEIDTDPPLVHLDLYRIETPREVDGLGLDELFAADAVAVVEWPERAYGRLPDDALHLTMTHAGGDRRRVEATG